MCRYIPVLTFVGTGILQRKGKSMVKHIVLYTLKPGTDKPAAIALIRSVLEPLVGVIPGLKHLEIRAAYEGGMDYALYSEFESRQALKDYAEHPAHLAAKAHFWEMLDSRVCADYDV